MANIITHVSSPFGKSLLEPLTCQPFFGKLIAISNKYKKKHLRATLVFEIHVFVFYTVILFFISMPCTTSFKTPIDDSRMDDTSTKFVDDPVFYLRLQQLF